MKEEIKYATGETYLVVKGVRKYGGWALSGFTTKKKKPDVASDEVAIKLELKLPAALFEKPMLSAAINVEGEVPRLELTPETINNIANIMRSTTGLDVQITVVEP